MSNFLDIFRTLELPDFEWMQKADRDSIVGFGCLILFGIALAVGV
jgi:hypothetical protein